MSWQMAGCCHSVMNTHLAIWLSDWLHAAFYLHMLLPSWHLSKYCVESMGCSETLREIIHLFIFYADQHSDSARHMGIWTEIVHNSACLGYFSRVTNISYFLSASYTPCKVIHTMTDIKYFDNRYAYTTSKHFDIRQLMCFMTSAQLFASFQYRCPSLLTNNITSNSSHFFVHLILSS